MRIHIYISNQIGKIQTQLNFLSLCAGEKVKIKIIFKKNIYIYISTDLHTKTLTQTELCGTHLYEETLACTRMTEPTETSWHSH